MCCVGKVSLWGSCVRDFLYRDLAPREVLLEHLGDWQMGPFFPVVERAKKMEQGTR